MFYIPIYLYSVYMNLWTTEVSVVATGCQKILQSLIYHYDDCNWKLMLTDGYFMKFIWLEIYTKIFTFCT